MISQSKVVTKNNHLYDLRMMLDLMRAQQLKMNPTKSFLGVLSGKFLGFIVISKGIHLDSDKIKAIQDMQPPKIPKNLGVYKADWPTP